MKTMNRWKMNAARFIGNSRDPQYVSGLIKAFKVNSDERVRGMAAWALGQIGGLIAKETLAGFLGALEFKHQECRR